MCGPLIFKHSAPSTQASYRGIPTKLQTILYKTRGLPSSVRSFITLRVPPLDSETGRTGEFWSKTKRTSDQIFRKRIFFFFFFRIFTFLKLLLCFFSFNFLKFFGVFSKLLMLLNKSYAGDYWTTKMTEKITNPIKALFCRRAGKSFAEGWSPLQ